MSAGQALGSHGLALAVAEAELTSQGFTKTSERTWHGLLCEHPEPVTADVELPEIFPFVLPLVRVNRRVLSRRIPHVEHSGKICLAPQNGIQIVARRPRDLIAEALTRARGVIENGLAGANDRDFQREFMAYWVASNSPTVCSISSPTRTTGRAIAASVASSRHPAWKSPRWVFADSIAQVNIWANRLGLKVQHITQALLLALEAPFDPPDFDTTISIGEFLRFVLPRLAETDRNVFQRLLGEQSLQLPLMVLVSMPSASAEDRVLFGARFPRKSRVDDGFRRGHIPLGPALQRASGASLQTLDVERFDTDFVIQRGGGNLALLDKRAVVIGCGAVGGAVALHLAAAGIGSLHLVDKEILASANIHRHVLGASESLAPKVEGLRRAIGARFPHVEVTCDNIRIEVALERDKNRIQRADVILIALGDPSLEAWLNLELREGPPRLHTWLEPHGLGGHVLLTGGSVIPGCFECLVDSGDTPGLKGGLASAAFDYSTSFAGCTGTFTPYGELDAARASIETVRLALAVLQGELRDSLLVSWMEDPARFLSLGFDLSARGRTFRAWEVRRESGFIDPTCHACSQ